MGHLSFHHVYIWNDINFSGNKVVGFVWLQFLSLIVLHIIFPLIAFYDVCYVVQICSAPEPLLR